eukprot:TRINITY_DN17545_c0_g1_i1.p1 TRINITY_DN17545_c0_g1~~TRINITY_DN17545_c0_g1_i1.p1  ORF type:complete len:473 (-),score=64.54 TRINITY_DN17545_c0_g1_i1:213-1631(-)
MLRSSVITKHRLAAIVACAVLIHALVGNPCAEEGSWRSATFRAALVAMSLLLGLTAAADAKGRCIEPWHQISVHLSFLLAHYCKYALGITWCAATWIWAFVVAHAAVTEFLLISIFISRKAGCVHVIAGCTLGNLGFIASSSSVGALKLDDNLQKFLVTCGSVGAGLAVIFFPRVCDALSMWTRAALARCFQPLLLGHVTEGAERVLNEDDGGAGVLPRVIGTSREAQRSSQQALGSSEQEVEPQVSPSEERDILQASELVLSCVPRHDNVSSADLRKWLMALKAVRKLYHDKASMAKMDLKPRWVNVISLIYSWAVRVIDFVDAQAPSRRETACRAWLRRFVSAEELRQYDDKVPLSRIDDLMSWILREHRQLSFVERQLRKSQLRDELVWQILFLKGYPLSLSTQVAVTILEYLKPASDELSTGSVTTYWDRLLQTLRESRAATHTLLCSALWQVEQTPHTFEHPMPNYF